MSTGIERIAAAFAATEGRAALMPYLMGGFPDLDASRAIGEAYADGGADLVERDVRVALGPSGVVPLRATVAQEDQAPHVRVSGITGQSLHRRSRA